MDDKPPRPTYDQLAALDAIRRHKSLAVAADELSIKRSSLSHLLERLQKRTLQGRLHEIHQGRVVLTPAGERIARSAASVLAGYRDISQISVGDGGIRITLWMFPAHLILFEATLFGFERAGAVDLEFGAITDSGREGDSFAAQLERLGAGLDAVIGPGGREVGPRIKETRLYAWKLRLIVEENSPFYAQRSVAIRELAKNQIPLLVSPSGHSSRRLIDDSAADTQLSLNIRVEGTDVVALQILGRQGRGTPILPDDSFGVAPDAGWPVVNASRGRALGGHHSIYWSDDQTPENDARTQAINQLAVRLRRAAERSGFPK